MSKRKIRIVFLGTPDFAVASLKALVETGFDVCAVVTAPDRPAGRGRKLRQSPVKEYALEQDIDVLQPEKLKDNAFLETLKGYEANLFIVVAFRMLPREVWEMPELGTFNLHASLLPQYRGAAPINRSVMNGESRGGVTTFFLQHKIDTGNIIFREETPIGPDETAGEYHDRLMLIGAGLVVKTVEAIRNGKVETIDQDSLLAEGEPVMSAPKIFKEDCRIDWNSGSGVIYNQIRGLSPSPGAYTEIDIPGQETLFVKIFRARIKQCHCFNKSGTVLTDYKTYLDICCRDACISVLEIQQSGKKRLSIRDFLAGLKPRHL